MLFLGIILHRTPRRFLNSVNDAVKNVGGLSFSFRFMLDYGDDGGIRIIGTNIVMVC